jgi:ADP-ribosylation factor GTPase-activating protein 2/3
MSVLTIIKSEMYQDKLNKFQGSQSISSDDFFGDGSSGKNKPSNYAAYTPDMNVLKSDLREGVTKMAGKLSNMATNVMSSFQVT